MAKRRDLCHTAGMRPARTSPSRTAAHHAALLWILGLCAASRSVRAADDAELQLEWRAPANCADRAELSAQIEARLPERPRARATLRARGWIELTRGGYRLELETEQGRRTLLAPECEELTSAAALMLALLIDPHTGPVPPPTAAATARRTRVVWALLRAELEADLGTLPSFALGPGLSLGVRVFATSIEVSGYYLPKQDVFDAQHAAALGELHALGLGLAACQALTSPVELSPCLRIEYGRIAGQGSNLNTSTSKADAPFVLALLGGRLSAELVHNLRAVLDLAIGLPLLGATFTVNPVGTVHQTSDVVGRLRAGIELRL
jgi:hypothetical protein